MQDNSTNLKNQPESLKPNQTASFTQNRDDLFRRLFHSANIGIILIDLNQNFIEVNAAICEMLGYSEHEMLQMNLRDIAVESDNQENDERLKRLYNQQLDNFKVRKRYVQKSGQCLWVQVTVTLMKEQNGQLIGTLGIIENIQASVEADQARQAAESALQESERRLASLISNLPGFAYSQQYHVNQTEPPTFLSDGVFELTGYPADDFYSAQIDRFNLILEQDRPYVNEALHHSLDTHQSYEMAYRIQTASQEIRWLLERGRPIYYNSEIFLEGFIADITALKTAELLLKKQSHELEERVSQRTRELQEGKSLLKSLIDSIPDLIYYRDKKGHYLGCNKAYEQFAGMPEAQIIGKTFGQVFQSKLTAEFEASDQLVIEQNRAMSFDHKVKTRQGQEISLEILKSPYLGPNNQILGVIGVCHDITERKLAEQALIQAQQTAQEASLAKGAFLANMSHEIRTPMNAILGLNHLLARTKLDTKQRDYVNKVQASAQNLLGIINDILDFSKIEAGKLDIERIPFDLNKILENLVTLLALKADEKGLDLIFDLRGQVPMQLIGDPLRLEQILLNLANNAIKFTHHGSVTLTVSLEVSGPESVQLNFSVSDTGVGMSPEQIKLLFQPFSQADSSTTRNFGGTGLGLTISQRLAELLGGEIQLESQIGQGSRFWFNLPFKQQTQNPQKATIPTLTNKKVLVVDDQDYVRVILTNYLEDFGMKVEVSESGEQALAILKAAELSGETFDLVLLDWKMPGLDGFETYRLFQTSLESPQPAVIMMTAYGREDFLQQAEHLSLSGFLIKPLTPSMVYDAVLSALDMQDLASENNYLEESWREKLLPYIGTRILLVEDNLINQQVAQELLMSEGFEVEIANNGLQAIEMLNEKDFQLVLMDLQMPVMDGYTATRRIREQQKWADLPILAMTADAVTGVQEQTLAAGMNDYVTKPIHIEYLFKTLIKWLPEPSPEALSQALAQTQRLNRTQKPSELETEIHLPEITGIHLEEALERVSGNHRVYIGLLERFTDSYSHFADDYINLQSYQSEEKERLVHTLSGVAGNLGMAHVQQAAKALEQALRQQNSQQEAELLPELLIALKEILSDLPAILSAYQNQTATPTLQIDIAEQLSALGEALENYDSTAEAHAKALAQSGFAPEILPSLLTAIHNFDFDLAQELFQTLLTQHSQEAP